MFWQVSFIGTARQSTQQFAARHPWKKPFSVEVNGPAQINGRVWVSLCVNKAPENSPGALIWCSRTPVTPQPASRCPWTVSGRKQALWQNRPSNSQGPFEASHL